MTPLFFCEYNVRSRSGRRRRSRADKQKGMAKHGKSKNGIYLLGLRSRGASLERKMPFLRGVEYAE